MFRFAILLGCLILAAPALAAANDAPTSPAARKAIHRHEIAMRKADEAWQRAAMEAYKTLISELEQAKAAAMKATQLDEANAIQAAIDEARKGRDQVLGKAKTFTIRADQDWQPTVEVQAGQRVEITASGRWCADKKNREVWTVGPAGRKHPRTGEPVCYLEARLNGQTRPVGASASFTADADGVLEFRLHDPGGRDDNEGGVRVVVR